MCIETMHHNYAYYCEIPVLWLFASLYVFTWCYSYVNFYVYYSILHGRIKGYNSSMTNSSSMIIGSYRTVVG